MIWKQLGFSKDIFFVEPLTPTAEDMRLFVGRDEEAGKFLVDTLSGERSLKFVSGDIGVGKTTFVNACQYFSYTQTPPQGFPFDIPKVLPCFEKIQLRETDNLDVLFQQTITAVCRSVVHHCRKEGIEPPGDVKETLSYFLDLSIQTSARSVSVGGSVFGSGGQVGVTPESRVPNVLRDARSHLKRLVKIVVEDLGFHGAFIFVNNLDILPKSKLINFVDNARDELFDIPRLFWILVGRTGLQTVVESGSERVADYLTGTESRLFPLGFDKTMDVIRARVSNFSVHDKAQSPLPESVIKSFHYLSMKETRETLAICGEIVRRVLMIDPSYHIIPAETALGVYLAFARERVKELELTESQNRVLRAVYDKQACRPRDHQMFGYATTQGFIAALKGLAKKRLLAVEEKGRARIYRMTGMTMFAAITGALGPELQKTAEGKLRDDASIAQDEDEFGSAQLKLELDEQSSDEDE